MVNGGIDKWLSIGVVIKREGERQDVGCSTAPRARLPPGTLHTGSMSVTARCDLLVSAIRVAKCPVQH